MRRPEAEAEKRYQELHDWGSDRLQAAINELKGFYVKTGQVHGERQLVRTSTVLGMDMHGIC